PELLGGRRSQVGADPRDRDEEDREVHRGQERGQDERGDAEPLARGGTWGCCCRHGASTFVSAVAATPGRDRTVCHAHCVVRTLSVAHIVCVANSYFSGAGAGGAERSRWQIQPSTVSPERWRSRGAWSRRRSAGPA